MPTETYTTNYEATVPEHLRAHVASLMQGWTDDGRSDNRIDNLVKSAVLAAYAKGHEDGAKTGLRWWGSDCIIEGGCEGNTTPDSMCCDMCGSDRFTVSLWVNE